MGRPRSTKNRHMLPRLQKKGGSYYYTPFIDGKVKWQPLGKDYGAALTEWAKREQSGLPKGRLFEDLAREFELREVPNWAESTRELWPFWLAALMTTFAGVLVEDIAPTHIYGHVAKRREEKAKSSGLRERGVISSMLRSAVEWGWIKVNPAAGLRMKGEEGRDRYLKDTEFWAIYDKAPLSVQIGMELGYLTGLRIGDLLRLKSEDEIEEALWSFQKKNKVQGKYTITPQLRSSIAKAKLKGGPLAKTLLTKRGGKAYTYTGFRSLFYRAVRKAGVENCTFRDIRSKAITDFADKGRNPQDFSLHKSREQAEAYVKQHRVPTIEPMPLPSKTIAK